MLCIGPVNGVRAASARSFAALLLVLFLVVPGSVRAQDYSDDGSFDFSLDYRRDLDFEQQIASRNRHCLPEPLPLVEHNYLYRFGEAVARQCVTGNMTEAQGVKYMMLGMIALSTGPIGAAAMTYTAGELTSDGMKCTLKSMIDAMEGLTETDKQNWFAIVDTGFAARDWRDFTRNVGTSFANWRAGTTRAPEYVSAKIETLAAVYERVNEGAGLAVALGEAIGDAYRIEASNLVRDTLLGEAVRRYDDGAAALRQCRIGEAYETLEAARKAAVEECRAKGIAYRLAEVQLRSLIFRSRSALMQNDALHNPFAPSSDLNPQQRNHAVLTGELETAREDLQRFSNIFANLTRLQNEAIRTNSQLALLSDDYRKGLDRARTALQSGGADACHAISVLEGILDTVPGGCQQIFVEKAVAQTPADLYAEVNANARARSQAWWDRLGAIRSDLGQCRLDAVDTGIAALQADIAANPIAAYIDGTCRTVDQPDLAAELRALAMARNTPATLPDVTGMGVAAAEQALRDVLLVSDLPDPAGDGGQGRVTGSDPAPGTGVPICTKVRLSLSGSSTGSDPTRPQPLPDGQQVGQSCGPVLSQEERQALRDELVENYAQSRWDEQYKISDVRTDGIYRGLRDDIIKADNFPIHYRINLPVWRARLACFDGCIMATPRGMQVNPAAVQAFRQCEAGCNDIRYARCTSEGKIQVPARGLDGLAPQPMPPDADLPAFAPIDIVPFDPGLLAPLAE